MKMKDFLSVTLLLLISIMGMAQVNNPQHGGALELSAEDLALIPVVTLTPESASTPLPSQVHNEVREYFPQILEQRDNEESCVQIAEISYVFTYEMNRLREVAAGDWGPQQYNMENLYHYLYTYNFLNDGSYQTPTYYKTGYELVKENGCPMYNEYYDPALEDDSLRFKYWMTGYDKYIHGMANGIDDYGTIELDTSLASLEVLKHWLADHNSGDTIGGIASIGIYPAVFVNTKRLPGDSPHANEFVITNLGSSGTTTHALTIVGYNDSIKYDFNEDGLYTRNVDLNGDSIIDLRDWETGAFVVANSKGPYWRNNGFIWLPYRFVPDRLANGSKAFVCYASDEYKPELIVKAQVDYPKRDKLQFRLGYAPNANEPTYSFNHLYYILDRNGDSSEMRGAYPGPIDLALDFGHYFIEEDFGKIFLAIKEFEYGTPSDGTINSYSIVDYRWGEEFELECELTNVPIINQNPPYHNTAISIDYDLIPHETPITQDLSLFSNMVSRFSPSVDNNSTLTIEQGVRIDMYNSDINIRSGSSLVIEDGVTFLAKRGQSKITVSGDIEIGDNVRFIAEDGAELELVLSSPYVQADIHRAEFDKASLVNYGMVLNIDSCTFNESGCLYSYDGDITVDQSTFTDTWLYIEDRGTCPDATFSMTNCTVNNPNVFVGANILNYGKFFIINNNILAADDGLRLYNCGSSNTGNQNILNNTISNCGGSGIMAYNVTASVANNHISGNDYGIRLLNGCNVALFGDISAQTHGATQEVMENDSYEIYISRYSFPWYFRYNYISDSSNLGNPTDPMVYYSVTSGGDMSQKDVRYNCWGNDFSASEDLYPPSYFDYTPTWCPGGSGSQTPTAEQMYSDGQDQFAAQQYSDSKATYTSLIDTYPKTVYAASAMKELTVLERFAGDDYSSLQNYFATNDSIQTDTTLRKLALKLCNVCDIKQENWPSAIDYFENIISNPETLEDSVFAIIDLGYVYFLMENSGFKSAYEGRFKEYIPKNKQKFREHRDYLLTLLPGTKSKQLEMPNTASAKQAELIGNSPNPFSESTVLSYRILQEGNVEISVMDASGQLIKKENLGAMPQGTYEYYLNTEGLSMGMYFYSISVNGQTFDIKKMTKIR